MDGMLIESWKGWAMFGSRSWCKCKGCPRCDLVGLEVTRVGQRIYTPKTNMDTKNLHSWLKRNLLWYHVISSDLDESSQSTYLSKLTFRWIESMAQLRVYEHTHTLSMKILQNRWYIYPTTWHDRRPVSNPTAHREFGLIISHKLDLSTFQFQRLKKIQYRRR